MQKLCNEVQNQAKESEGGKMTEIEQLRADLQTLRAAAIVPGMRPKTYEQIEAEIILNEQRIAALALQAEQPVEPDPWKDAKDNVASWLDRPQYDGTDRHTVALYVCHLESELAKRTVLESADALLQEMERRKAATADYLREKLAELITILNAIPPACSEAQALIQARIDAVKQEMQGNDRS